MKKLALLIALVSCGTAYAQVKDLMLKKAGSMIGGKKTETTNTTTTTDSTGKTTTTTTSSDQSNASGSNPWMMKMGSKSDCQPEYNFNANIYVEIQNYKKNGELDGDKANVRYHFTDTEEYYGTEMVMADKKGKVTESFGVTEFQKGQIISLINNEGEKTGTVMKVDLQKQVDKHNDTSGIKVTKTGRTKDILGYGCEEYIMTDKDGNKTEYWITKALNYDLAKMMAGDRSKSNAVPGYESGFMMEMTYFDKDGKKTTWKVLEVNKASAKKVVIADYSFPY